MTPFELMHVAESSTMQNRVKYYLQKWSVFVRGKSISSTPGELFVYADSVLLGTAPVKQAVIAVLTNATISARASEDAILDSDIDFVLNPDNSETPPVYHALSSVPVA